MRLNCRLVADAVEKSSAANQLLGFSLAGHYGDWASASLEL